MKCDEYGNVWVTGPKGLWVFNPKGVQLGVIQIPEHTANLHWGGIDWHTLFVTASTSVYSITTKVGPRIESFMRDWTNTIRVVGLFSAQFTVTIRLHPVAKPSPCVSLLQSVKALSIPIPPQRLNPFPAIHIQHLVQKGRKRMLSRVLSSLHNQYYSWIRSVGTSDKLAEITFLFWTLLKMPMHHRFN